LKTLIKIIDLISDYVARITCLSAYILLFVVIYEVIARKLFKSPTVWGFELSTMLYAAMFVLGGSYTLKQKGHVAIDLLTIRLKNKHKSIISIFTYLIFFFPFMITLVYATGLFALQSWLDLERSQSPWNQPLYHFKTLMPLGFGFLLLQGLSEFFKNIFTILEDKKK